MTEGEIAPKERSGCPLKFYPSNLNCAIYFLLFPPNKQPCRSLTKGLKRSLPLPHSPFDLFGFAQLNSHKKLSICFRSLMSSGKF